MKRWKLVFLIVNCLYFILVLASCNNKENNSYEKAIDYAVSYNIFWEECFANKFKTYTGKECPVTIFKIKNQNHDENKYAVNFLNIKHDLSGYINLYFNEATNRKLIYAESCGSSTQEGWVKIYNTTVIIPENWKEIASSFDESYSIVEKKLIDGLKIYSERYKYTSKPVFFVAPFSKYSSSVKIYSDNSSSIFSVSIDGLNDWAKGLGFLPREVMVNQSDKSIKVKFTQYGKKLIL